MGCFINDLANHLTSYNKFAIRDNQRLLYFYTFWPGLKLRKVAKISTETSFLYCCLLSAQVRFHYNDVVISAMTSQITSLTLFCSTVYSGRRSKKTSKLRVTGLCEFPAQKASNEEKVSIWLRHYPVAVLWRHTNIHCDIRFTLILPCVLEKKFLTFGAIVPLLINTINLTNCLWLKLVKMGLGLGLGLDVYVHIN